MKKEKQNYESILQEAIEINDPEKRATHCRRTCMDGRALLVREP